MPDVSWQAARRIAHEAASPVPAERTPLAEAVERVLAEPALALVDLPGFDTSAMDGWAVCGFGPWQIIGAVLAGAAPPEQLVPGEAVTIATGAAVPTGATSVVRSEDGTVIDGHLQSVTTTTGAHIRPRGEECRVGETLAAAGTVVTPAVGGLLAAAGLDDVSVRTVPRAALLLLGDELLDAGLPGVGQVRDSLGPQLPGWLSRLGATVDVVVRVADTVADLVAALRSARDSDMDVILTTGGTAAGPVDCLHAALAELGGRLLVDSVAVRPGHPMVLADLAGVPLVGLPGNPQSAVVSLMTLGAPVVRSLLGQPEELLAEVTLAEDVTAPNHENRLVLGTVSGGRFTAASHLGSAMLRGLSVSEGFAVLPPTGAAAGAVVGWLPLP